MIRKIKSALISVSDKTEISKLLKILKKYNVKINQKTLERVKNFFR